LEEESWKTKAKRGKKARIRELAVKAGRGKLEEEILKRKAEIEKVEKGSWKWIAGRGE
jgi:hypothetical protein